MKNYTITIILLGLIIFPVVPYVLGVKSSIKVFNSGITGGLGSGQGGFYALPPETTEKQSLYQQRLDVSETFIPKTTGGGSERTAYRFLDNYYLVGITSFMIPSALLLMFFLVIFIIGRMPHIKTEEN
jgi:hypothetical protein